MTSDEEINDNHPLHIKQTLPLKKVHFLECYDSPSLMDIKPLEFQFFLVDIAIPSKDVPL